MSKRILVVDDAAFMRRIVKGMLTSQGFEICGDAANCNEAVEQYEKHRPDLVTLDITMVEQDGVDAAREILARDPNARIVMVTALGKDQRLLDCLALGVKDFVVKPFQPEKIASVVRKALD